MQESFRQESEAQAGFMDEQARVYEGMADREQSLAEAHETSVMSYEEPYSTAFRKSAEARRESAARNRRVAENCRRQADLLREIPALTTAVLNSGLDAINADDALKKLLLDQ